MQQAYQQVKAASDALYHGEVQDAETALATYIAGLEAEIRIPDPDGDNRVFREALVDAQKAQAILKSHLAAAILRAAQEIRAAGGDEMECLAEILETGEFYRLAF